MKWNPVVIAALGVCLLLTGCGLGPSTSTHTVSNDQQVHDE